MKILFCVEFYYPSIGGAQEVVRQLAEHMVLRGHAVSVATSCVEHRKALTHNGVNIVEFAVSGNSVRGLQGEVRRYQSFLADGEFDVVMFYAAQQWTFDAAWPVMSSIKARRVLVPCGYSALYDEAYRTYFESLPAVLRLMDAVIYHAEDYRDVRFGRLHGLRNDVMIPNGADLDEFDVPREPGFRRQVSATDSALVLLTVGTMTGRKGHLELAQAFSIADFKGRKAVLILNGNVPDDSAKSRSILMQLPDLIREYGWVYAARHSTKMLLKALGIDVGRSRSFQDWVKRINREQRRNKHVVVVDMPRRQLIQAYLNADLFVFASNVEYSPLVLFEACAAGLPFLTVPVGNAQEIVAWTGGGEICEATVDEQGYTHVSPVTLARRIEEMVANTDELALLGRRAREASKRRFNWQIISAEYECLFARLTTSVSPKQVA